VAEEATISPQPRGRKARNLAKRKLEIARTLSSWLVPKVEERRLMRRKQAQR
jgi:hypothetical protein